MAEFKYHTSCDECGSKNNKAVYSDGSSHCFGCLSTVPSKEYLEENSNKPKRKSSIKSFSKEPMQTEVKPSGKPAMTRERYDEIKAETTTDITDGSFRGIRTDISKKFGVRYSFDEDGTMLAQYCPITKAGELVGLKVRDLPKDFYSEGLTGAECDLFMQFKFNRGGRAVIITEGELDALSAFQMMHDYNQSKGGTFETAVVSPTTGANSHKQIAGQYKFFDTFDSILLCYDNDSAGEKALEDIIKVLPKGKVKLMKLPMKDANDMLRAGRQREFVSAYFNAKPYVPVGVMGSGQLYNSILAQVEVPKMTFPPFMQPLNELTSGGIPLGYIVNIAAGTGLGKTTLVNEILYHWIFNSPHLLGVVSMELDAGQYGETLLSRHIRRKLANISDAREKIELIRSPEVQAKADELFFKDADKTEHRFYLLDNRDGSIEEIQDTIEELVVSCGCKVIILDVLQDLMAGLTNEEQEAFMKWCKGMVKSHGISFVLINHVRKSPTGTKNSSSGGAFMEEEIQGSSSIIKSSGFNILLSRDKYHEDPVVQNTTNIVLSKNRVTGRTGPAGKVYYDNDTHTLHDFDTFFNQR